MTHLFAKLEITKTNNSTLLRVTIPCIRGSLRDLQNFFKLSLAKKFRVIQRLLLSLIRSINAITWQTTLFHYCQNFLKLLQIKKLFDSFVTQPCRRVIRIAKILFNTLIFYHLSCYHCKMGHRLCLNLQPPFAYISHGDSKLSNAPFKNG